MAKFLDKKERVIDFQLTPYGKHRLSVGQLKPAYYAFFDTGVLYDSEYAGFKETQNKIHERIKTETQFIEGVLLFEEAETSVPPSQHTGRTGQGMLRSLRPGSKYTAKQDTEDWKKQALKAKDAWMIHFKKLFDDDKMKAKAYSNEKYLQFMAQTTQGGLNAKNVNEYFKIIDMEYVTTEKSLFDLDLSPVKYVPKPEILSFGSSIGDARFEGDNVQAAPAWKWVACQGEFSAISTKDTTKYNLSNSDIDLEETEFNIPQIDVKAFYTLEISSPTGILEEETISDFVSETDAFSDGNTIKLIRNDVMIYGEELNTEFLTENFDIEVFELHDEAGEQVEASGFLNFLSGAANVPQAGDYVTINDGINWQTFEFVANSVNPSKIRDSLSNPNNIAVVIPSNYYLKGATGAHQNRVGSILNLISAINQDNGSTDFKYPTDPRKDATGNVLRGRCKYHQAYSGGCYSGKHNLNVSIPEGVINQFNNPYGFGGYNINMTMKIRIYNHVLQNGININTPIVSSAARISPDGFSNGKINKGAELTCLYFADEIPQIVDGFMQSANPRAIDSESAANNTDSIEYYFDMLTDSEVNAKIACSCASNFNKNSYYIDIDFDCVDEEMEQFYYDIYGSATSPEICDLPPTTLGDLRALNLANDGEECEDIE